MSIIEKERRRIESLELASLLRYRRGSNRFSILSAAVAITAVLLTGSLIVKELVNALPTLVSDPLHPSDSLFRIALAMAGCTLTTSFAICLIERNGQRNDYIEHQIQQRLPNL